MIPEDVAAGGCWLTSHRPMPQLFYVGVAVTAGTHLPLFSCGPCLHALRERTLVSSGADCVLWCGRPRAGTLRIGSIEDGGYRADLRACPECVGLLEATIVHAALCRDGTADRIGALRHQRLWPSGRLPAAA